MKELPLLLLHVLAFAGHYLKSRGLKILVWWGRVRRASCGSTALVEERRLRLRPRNFEFNHFAVAVARSASGRIA